MPPPAPIRAAGMGSAAVARDAARAVANVTIRASAPTDSDGAARVHSIGLHTRAPGRRGAVWRHDRLVRWVPCTTAAAAAPAAAATAFAAPAVPSCRSGRQPQTCFTLHPSPSAPASSSFSPAPVASSPSARSRTPSLRHNLHVFSSSTAAAAAAGPSGPDPSAPSSFVASSSPAQPALAVRVADPRDAAALAALDASCAADGSSGWSEGIYQSDLGPGNLNLILLCELLPPSALQQRQQGQEQQQQPETAQEPLLERPLGLAKAVEPAPLVVALAAGCEVAGEVSLTNLGVAVAMRGAGLGLRMAVELLKRLGAERHPTFLEVRKDNAAAQALYGKLGFEVVGLRRRYNADGSDSLAMVRQPGPLPLLRSPAP